MPSFLRTFLHSLESIRMGGNHHALPDAPPIKLDDFAMPANDALSVFLRHNPNVVDVHRIPVQSEALDQLKRRGVRLIAPLVCRGELVGLVNLGPRMSTQEYSQEDITLLNNLITQAAPALRVAQLAEVRKAEALESERLSQELRVARLIQQTLLPKEQPILPGWRVSSYYGPARAVGGDFYDFLAYPDGRMAFVIGDVTDKGMPAALLMATTRATLRATAQRYLSPGEVLEQVNESLVPDTPDSMFVTCLFALLDPRNGRLVYANAGHNLPYRLRDGQVAQLHATGMPLGLLPGMHYDEVETTIEPGETLVLYSDGLVEARDQYRELFGNARLEALLAGDAHQNADLIPVMLAAMQQFVGDELEQEDDVTLVEICRKAADGQA